MDFAQIGTFAKAHKVEAGIIAVVGGLGVLYFLRAMSSSTSSGQTQDDGSAAAAYYAAESAQAQAGDALQATQIQANAAVDINGQNTQADTTDNSTWATTNLATTNADNANAISLAPFEETETLYAALASIASEPGITSTNVNKSSGFLGIGGGTKASSTTVPNPAATAAATALENLLSVGNNAGT